MSAAARELSTFEALDRRFRLRGRLVAETGLRIGGGDRTVSTITQAPILRDALGRPLIPGSSLKGVLRSGLEALLRGLGRETPRACDPFAASCTADLEEAAKKRRTAPDLDDVLRQVCDVCALFGSPLLAGRLFIRDLEIDETKARPTEIRDGVGIDRDLRVARTHPAVKYDFEVVPAGSEFSFEMVVENPSDAQLGLLFLALGMLERGEIGLGGLTSRGLGRVRLEGLACERTDADLLFEGVGYQEAPLDELRQTASEALRALAAEEGD